MPDTDSKENALALARDAVPTLARHAAEADRSGRFPVDSVRTLRESGLFGLLIPGEYGGLGGSLADMVAAAQVLASGCVSTAMIWAMHCQQVDALVRFGTDELHRTTLPQIARGEVYLASVTTEPGKGGHLLTAASSLRTDGDLLVVERDGPIVTGVQHADGFLVTMRHAADLAENQVSLVYLHRDQARVEVRGEWDALGMRGTESLGIRLTGTVPPAQLVGEAGRFRTVATESMIPAGHLGWSACWLGAAQNALAEVIGLIRSPRRPRSLAPRSDLTAERIARIRMDLEVVSAYLYRVCEEVLHIRAAGGSIDTPSTQFHLNTLKVLAAENTFRAVDRLVQLSGLATGYLKGSTVPLERHFRDLRSASLNYANDRLLVANGGLALLDRAVRLLSTPSAPERERG